MSIQIRTKETKMDEASNEAFYEHFGQMLIMYTSMVVLGITGASAETRTMATNEAKALSQHMADDLAHLLGLDNQFESDEAVEDFNMWANELKQN